MLIRLFSWLFGRNKEHIFKPKHRLIYSYFDGSKVVKADPMVLYTKVMDVAPSLSIDFKVSNSPLKDANKAYHNLIKTIRGIFSIKEFSDEGLNEIEVMELLNDFMEYVDTVKKNLNSYQISQTATSPTSEFTSTEVPPTKNSSESGSTEKEQILEKQDTLPSQ